VIGSVTKEQEAIWDKEKRAAYMKWHTEKLTAAVGYLSGLSGDEWVEAMAKIENKFGKRFATDVRQALNGRTD
jgi:hypothetical protein